MGERVLLGHIWGIRPMRYLVCRFDGGIIQSVFVHNCLLSEQRRGRWGINMVPRSAASVYYRVAGFGVTSTVQSIAP